MTPAALARVSDIVEATDAELARRTGSGNAAAFDVLVDRHYASCLRFAWRQLGNRQDAEEAVQDAFVRAYRALRERSEPEHFRAWLMAIVVNRCRTYGARNRRRRALIERLLGTRANESVAAPPETKSEEPRDPRIIKALDRLSPALREAFLLKHVEDMTYEEMAGVTGAKVSALKMRVKRATETLAHELGDSHD